LETEELYWNPKLHKLWSDSLVHVFGPDRELFGDGFEAQDDFSNYKFKKPRGRLPKI